MTESSGDTGNTGRFWEGTELDALSEAQWESLCDGCGRCCLQKLEDEDTGELFFTRIACRQLTLKSCRCKDYDNRFERVADCTNVRPLTEEKAGWLPPTCAYRLLAEGKPLHDWHPLLSGDPNSVHDAGISVRHLGVSERMVAIEQYPAYVIDFSADPDVGIDQADD